MGSKMKKTVAKEEMDTFISAKLTDIIVDPARNCRSRGEDYDEKIQSLAKSIKATGLHNPLLVLRDVGGKYCLISGYRRFAAVCSLGWESVAVKLASVEGKDAEEVDRKIDLINLLENTARADLTPPEMASRLHDLCIRGYEKKVLVGATGLSKSHVDNLIRLKANLTAELWSLFAKGGEKGYEVAKYLRLASLPPQDQMATLIAESEKPIKEPKEPKESKEPKGFAPEDIPTSESEPVYDQKVVVTAFLSEARGIYSDEFLDGAEAMWAYISMGTPIPPVGSFPGLK
jgi:ParB/RepB/Spo0J family partition protein